MRTQKKSKRVSNKALINRLEASISVRNELMQYARDKGEENRTQDGIDRRREAIEWLKKQNTTIGVHELKKRFSFLKGNGFNR